MDTPPKTIRELMATAFARYITVRPDGFELRPGEIVPSLAACLLGYHSARTLYENRRPVCRSLDGVRAVTLARRCDECCFRNKCTPQVCADLLADGIPARLLLAFTSLRNFLVFIENRRRSGLGIEGAQIHLAVRNRGHWGEVPFLPEPGAKALSNR
jgi:hypothetical protein